MNQQYFDVIIIGGGPAGMSAALILGRSRVKTLILNTENPRNIVTTHTHGFLTQDGKHPLEIFKIAKEQLKKYPSVSYRKEKALELFQLENGFKIISEQGEYISKRVLLATGHKDNIEKLNLPGIEEVYGRSVYPCPFCDGFEMADKKLAVFGDANMGTMFSKVIANWSDDVIVFTNGEKVQDQRLVENLERNNIRIIEKEIKELVSIEGQLKKVVFSDNTSIEREGGFIPDTKSTESVNFAKQLDIPTEEGHFGLQVYQVDENKETKVKGFYIIGDAKTGWSGVVGSVAEGSDAATAITHQIIEERWNGKI